MARFYVDWNADGIFALEADDQAEAEDKAYEMVRDYVDARQLGGDFAVFVEQEED